MWLAPVNAARTPTVPRKQRPAYTAHRALSTRIWTLWRRLPGRGFGAWRNLLKTDQPFGELHTLEVTADVHLESQPVPGVDQLRDELRLRGLARDERVAVGQAPTPLVRLHRVGGDASLHQLAVRRNSL